MLGLDSFIRRSPRDNSSAGKFRGVTKGVVAG